MSEVLTPDICVIGGGSAGLTVAKAAAGFGVSAVLVEKKRLGGVRLNNGCIASKALLAAARHVNAIREAGLFGAVAGRPEIDFPAVMAHVQEVIAAVEPNDSPERFIGLGVTVVEGAARFRDRRTVLVGTTEIRARRFVVATGARPSIPAIENIETVPFLTSETIFGLMRRPAHLIVIGGGATGIELAQAFYRLGSDVTVLESGRALSQDDPELSTLLIDCLRSEGVKIRENAPATRVAKRGRGGVRVTIGVGEDVGNIDGTHLLVATGRVPAIEELGLREAGIATNANGILVDRRLRTTNRLVYAIGDVIDGPRFAHWGAYQAGQVIRSIIFRFGGRADGAPLPCVTFTDPELAHVGLSEEDARLRHRDVEVLRWPFSENDRAQAERATRGLVKIVVTKRGRILGAEILDRHAGELIAPFVLAVRARLSVRSLATAVFPYPTLSEAGQRAAIDYYTPRISAPYVKKIIRLLRRLG